MRDVLLRSGRDYEYRSLREYVFGAQKHLAANGRLLLGTGDSAGVAEIDRLAVDAGYRLISLCQAELPIEKGSGEMITYMLCELIRERVSGL